MRRTLSTPAVMLTLGIVLTAIGLWLTVAPLGGVCW